MTALLVDLGNTRLKWGTWADTRLRPGGAFAWHDGDPATLLDQAWSARPHPERVLVASVTEDHHTRALTQWCRATWQRAPEFLVSRPQAGGVRNGYREPARLGVDRWAALLGARAVHPDTPCAVIDCGTAITCDALAADGRHLGGAILPGLALMRQSLATTAGIDLQPGAEAPEPIADHTAGAVAGGTWLAAVAAIDRFVAHLEARLDRPMTGLITGGDAPHLAPHLRRPATLRPHLVLEGLAAAAAEDGNFHPAP